MVTAYPVAGKAKSLEICKAFVAGSGGEVVTDGKLRDGPAFFYGVDKSNVHIWKAVRADHARDFYYCDNSYFDASRQAYFRVTKNLLQHTGMGRSDGERFRALGVEVKPWRASGEHIVVCPQSDQFMTMVVGQAHDWYATIVQTLQRLCPQRQLRVRNWSPDKGKLAASLPDDLVGAHALVTWSSAAAVTALIEGVPVITLGQCAAAPLAGSLADVEKLPTPQRDEWAGVLADNQWTLREFADGTAWGALNG
jgi:hypothetical protein